MISLGVESNQDQDRNVSTYFLKLSRISRRSRSTFRSVEMESLDRDQVEAKRKPPGLEIDLLWVRKLSNFFRVICVDLSLDTVEPFFKGCFFILLFILFLKVIVSDLLNNWLHKKKLEQDLVKRLKYLFWNIFTRKVH